MIEFITQYWHFFVAGLILIALITYWVVDVIRNKKAKEKELNELEAKLATEEETTQEKEIKEEPVVLKEKTPAKQKKVVAEKVEEPAKEEQVVEPVEEEQPVEETKEVEPSEKEEEEKKLGSYMISYDKEKKEWVIKRRGSQRATKRTKTKKEALDLVEKLSQNQEVGFTVKKKDGKFQKK